MLLALLLLSLLAPLPFLLSLLLNSPLLLVPLPLLLLLLHNLPPLLALLSLLISLLLDLPLLTALLNVMDAASYLSSIHEFYYLLLATKRPCR